MFADHGMGKGQFSNGLSAAEEEMLQICEEECAELIQAISKIRRHGTYSNYIAGNSQLNMDNLHEETADVLACIAMLTHNKFLDVKRVNQIAREKLDRIKDPETKRVHFITSEMIP